MSHIHFQINSPLISKLIKMKKQLNIRSR